MRRLYAFLAVVLCIHASAAAKNLTVVYTGNTHSLLYPFRAQPLQGQGGLARRATILDEIRKSSEDVLVVDTGNFFGGGRLDPATVDYQSDAKRTSFCGEALDALGYDVAGVGDAEFNFGVDFLRDMISGRKFAVVAANIEIEGVLPYYLKQFKDYTVAVIGLADESAAEKSSVSSKQYISALRESLSRISGKADLIILLSGMEETINQRIAKEFPEIALILVSGDETSPWVRKDSPSGTIILKPSYGARELRVVELSFEGKKIKECNLIRRDLSPSVPESKTIKKMLPACISAYDCQPREGLAAACQDSGTDQARCVYVEARQIPAVLITDKNCRYCITFPTQDYLKEIFPAVTFMSRDYREKASQELLSQYGIETLPAFIIPESVAEEKNFSEVAKLFEQKGDAFIAARSLAGIFLFLNRETTPGSVDILFSPYDLGAGNILKTLQSLCQKRGKTLRIHIIVGDGENVSLPPVEQQEAKIALAVQALYPEQFLNYLAVRLTTLEEKLMQDIFESLGIDYRRIQEFLPSQQLQEMIAQSVDFAKELGVNRGIALLVDNRKIFSIIGINQQDLDRLLSASAE